MQLRPKAYRTISTQKRLLHSALCSSLQVHILFGGEKTLRIPA